MIRGRTVRSTTRRLLLVRVAFHSVPTYDDGTFVEPHESVGDPTWRGDSGGCSRVLPDDAVRIWDLLAIGDEMRVLN